MYPAFFRYYLLCTVVVLVKQSLTALIDIPRCGNPKVNPNSRWEYNNSVSRISWRCREGYQLLGVSTSNCTSNAQWSKNTPYCASLRRLPIAHKSRCLNVHPKRIHWLDMNQKTNILGIGLRIEEPHRFLDVTDHLEVFAGTQPSLDEGGLVLCNSTRLQRLATGHRFVKCGTELESLSVGLRIKGSRSVKICEISVLENHTSDCSIGYIHFQGGCYQLFQSATLLTWTEAKQMCLSHHSTMSTNSLIGDLSNTIDLNTNVWIGMTQKRPGGDWITDTGDSVEKTPTFGQKAELAAAHPMLPLSAVWPLCASVGAQSTPTSDVVATVTAEPCAQRLGGVICHRPSIGCGTPAIESRAVLVEALTDSYTTGSVLAYQRNGQIYCVQCEAGGTWTKPSRCTDNDVRRSFLSHSSTGCAVPSAPVDATVTVHTWGATAIAEYRCKRGFTLHGSPRRTCSISQGGWSGQQPTCVGSRCIMPPPIRNGRHLLSSVDSKEQTSRNTTAAGSVVLYSCDTGHVLNGANQLRCLLSGDWSAAWPSCSKLHKECPPITVTNAVAVYLDETRSSGDRVLITCDDGFDQYPFGVAPIIICTEKGAWNATIYCVKQQRPMVDNNVYSPPQSAGKQVRGSSASNYISNVALVGVAGLLVAIAAGCCVAAVFARRRSTKETKRILHNSSTSAAATSNRSMRAHSINCQQQHPASFENTLHRNRRQMARVAATNGNVYVDSRASHRVQRHGNASQGVVSPPADPIHNDAEQSPNHTIVPINPNLNFNRAENENTYERPTIATGETESRRKGRKRSLKQQQQRERRERERQLVSAKQQATINCHCVYVTDQLPSDDEVYFSDSVVSRPTRYYYSEVETTDGNEPARILIDPIDASSVHPNPRRLSRSYSMHARGERSIAFLNTIDNLDAPTTRCSVRREQGASEREYLAATLKQELDQLNQQRQGGSRRSRSWRRNN